MSIKNIILTFWLLSLSWVSLAHTLDETLQVLSFGGFDTRQMYVKLKHMDPRTRGFNKFMSASLIRFGARSENLFEPNYLPKLKNYQLITFPQALPEKAARALLIELYHDKNVDFAVFEPKFEDARIKTRVAGRTFDFDNSISDFEPLQDYLNSAPIGVDARYAWSFPGGTGRNVQIIDVETGSYTKHEDLPPFSWLGSETYLETAHGTAVAGEIVGKNDGKGITGISYDSLFGFIPREKAMGETDYNINLARVIAEAASKLSQGDLLVLELQTIGPQGDFLAVEYWEPIFDVLKAASEKGILCAAAAGNGSTDLDSDIFARAFDIKKRNSGCVLVGASYHPATEPGVPSRTGTTTAQGKLYERADFSNYGSRVDAFGYGENVVTTGYGDLAPGYTKDFAGTSSATPIVSGVIAVLSSLAQEQGRFLTSEELRKALRATGTPQQGNTKERIGNLPDLKALMNELNL